MFTTLITPEQLQQLQASATPLAVFDCTSDLMNPAAGAQQFAQCHVAGARHAHLDHHLSHHPHTAAADDWPASAGRHPLPSRSTFAAWLGSQGVGNGTQVVVYDRNGMNYCGRLWWMLKWCGHEAVAVLDGGLAAWQAAQGAVESGNSPAAEPARFELGEPLATLTDTATVLAGLGQASQTVLDARGAPRYRGEVEPLDPIAGHIPGALNRPFSDNLGPDGRFKPAAQLQAEFSALLAGRNPASVVHQCGSGVSAVPNLLAMELAGLGRQALYAGSWSEWSRTPGLPVEKG